MMNILLTTLYCYIGCMGYCLLVNNRGRLLFLAPLGSAICWLAYSFTNSFSSVILQCFIATIVASIYSEIMARKFKTPTTCFQIVSILPLVPGGGIYYTMEYCINGNIPEFINTGLHTFAIAGSIAMGILFVSSCAHIINMVKMRITSN